MSDTFLLGIIQTAIGSGLGFGLGIVAFHYQREQQEQLKANDENRAVLDALTRLYFTAGVNIEELAHFKNDNLVNFAHDIEKMHAAVEAFRCSPENQWPDKVGELVQASRSTRDFYMGMSKLSVLVPPEAAEYSALFRDMRALALFAHSAMGMMQELNELIEARNALLAERAREGGTSESLTYARLVYFSRQLTDHCKHICDRTDHALFAWNLVIKQIEAYFVRKLNDKEFVKYEFAPVIQKALPKGDPNPLMSKQLVTFQS